MNDNDALSGCLDKLSEDEKKLILSVIKRDEELSRAQISRANQLRTEIHNLRMQSVLRPGDDLARMCARCHKPFGRLFDTGDVCPQCKFKVCKICREMVIGRGWMCSLCGKQAQLTWLTGDWMYKSKRGRRPSGSDIIKSALHLSVANGLGNANEGGASRRSASRDDLERVGYPQDSDRARLTQLFDSFRSGRSGDQGAVPSVQRVSCRRKRDSSSSSTDDDEDAEVVSVIRNSRTPDKDGEGAAVGGEGEGGRGPSSSVSFTSSEPPNDKSDRGSVSSMPRQESPTVGPDGRPTKTPSPRMPRTPTSSSRSPNQSRPSPAPRSPQPARSPGSPGSSNRGRTESAASRSRTVSDASDAAVNSATESAQQVSLTVSASPSPSRQKPAASAVLREAPVLEESVRDTPGPREKGEAPTLTVTRTAEVPTHVRRTSSERSDASSLNSTRTASPATKMRLLDLASSRALEREASDLEERSSVEGAGSDVVVEEISRVPFRRISNKAHPGSPRKSKGEDGSSLGGDSGHISASSQDHVTPEHRGRSPQHSPRHSHLSVPSLTGSADDEDEDIDRLVASHRSLSDGRWGGSRGNLYSSLGGSRESIASVYSDAGEINYGKFPVTGEVLFGLDYNYKTGSLEIHVKQCKDIAMVDAKHKRSDPYVKTYLLPDKTRTGKRKTKIKKHTLNPTFDEILRYNISKSELENRTLWLTVWHNDRLGRNDFLGEVMIPLDCYKFGDPSPVWYPLQERLEAPSQAGGLPAYRGDMVISVKFVSADQIDKSSPRKSKGRKSRGESHKGELHVVVKEARNLTAVRSNGSSDPFCKGYLLPDRSKNAKQKTQVIKKNCSPAWHHMFVFEDVDQDELKERCLELTVWDYDKLTSNDFLGGVRLNFGTGQCLGKPAEWMDARGEELAAWQSIVDHPNVWLDFTLPLRSSMGKDSVKK